MPKERSSPPRRSAKATSSVSAAPPTDARAAPTKRAAAKTAGDAVRQTWLLVAVATTGPSSSLRVSVWRKLRSLGALYLQQSVCLLPERPDTSRAIARLLDRVRHEGGEARLLHITLSEADERAVIEGFQAERTDEYHEVCDRTPAFLAEIEKERARGRTTYAEVEESEVDLARLRSWLDKIRGRDYFDAPGRAEAEAEVERCADALRDFEAAALQADAPPPTPVRTSRRLRAVSD